MAFLFFFFFNFWIDSQSHLYPQPSWKIHCLQRSLWVQKTSAHHFLQQLHISQSWTWIESLSRIWGPGHLLPIEFNVSVTAMSNGLRPALLVQSSSTAWIWAQVRPLWSTLSSTVIRGFDVRVSGIHSELLITEISAGHDQHGSLSVSTSKSRYFRHPCYRMEHRGLPNDTCT